MVLEFVDASAGFWASLLELLLWLELRSQPLL